ncbi:MAG: hypothetical protein GX452_05740 [Ignavibacteriales bacterium]|nr:hypothetical protein [Ignavibacteriales bacterium]HOJ18110.1 hypothetical protein [Ignavibacteriaceae bacterium]HPO57191.1 hypothetical protein [Ignavibacteriaceae bacterium]
MGKKTRRTTGENRTDSKSVRKPDEGSGNLSSLKNIISDLLEKPFTHQLAAVYRLRYEIVNLLYNKCLAGGKPSPQMHKTKMNTSRIDPTDPDTYSHLMSLGDNKIWSEFKIYESNLYRTADQLKSLHIPANINAFGSDSPAFPEFCLPSGDNFTRLLNPPAEPLANTGLKYFSLMDDGSSASVIHSSLHNRGLISVSLDGFSTNFLNFFDKPITTSPRVKIQWTKSNADLYYLIHTFSDKKIIKPTKRIWITLEDCFLDRKGFPINTSSANAQYQKGCKNIPFLDILVDEIKTTLSGSNGNKKIN